MCGPMAAAGAMGVLQIGSTAYEIYEGNKTVAELAEAQVRSAEGAYSQNIARTSESTRQQEEAMSAQQRERQRQQMHEQGKALAAFGDTGVTGITPDKLISNTIMSGALDIAGIESTRDNVIMSDAAAKTDIDRQRMSSINQTRAFVASNYVSPLEAGLRIGTAGLSGASSGAGLYNNLT